MAVEPTLIIQMQRMGDLLLSFPLCSRLLALEPERPVWVVAEPAFFSELMPLAPGVVFFAPDMAPQLRTARFRRIINLSHREDALALAGTLDAEERLGAFRRNGVLYMDGAWRLYRASIVGNNRHNRFHWGDLEALGLVPPRILTSTAWPVPAWGGARPESGGRVGLFVGASEESKRPGPAFWAGLARLLLERGLTPVFLGGPAERATAAEAARLGGFPDTADVAGRFRLAELAAFMRGLDLVITPDTGPMHLAAWVGTPVLNLSMGPVNAWETAPSPPGHFVLRAADSCVGCWQCSRGKAACVRRFTPHAVAGLAYAMALAPSVLSSLPGMPDMPDVCGALRDARRCGLRLARTGRDARGLFTLHPVEEGGAVQAGQREMLAGFWQEWFLATLGGAPHTLPAALEALGGAEPRLLAALRRASARLAAGLSSGLKRRSLAGDFWQGVPPLLRPLSGYLHLLLQNGDFSRPVWSEAVSMAAAFAELPPVRGAGGGM